MVEPTPELRGHITVVQPVIPQPLRRTLFIAACVLAAALIFFALALLYAFHREADNRYVNCKNIQALQQQVVQSVKQSDPVIDTLYPRLGLTKADIKQAHQLNAQTIRRFKPSFCAKPGWFG